jgi:hypothetical protein
MSKKDKSDPHEDQWRRLLDLFNNKHEMTKEDFYKYRAEACQRLLNNYC